MEISAVQVYSICPPKKYEPREQAFVCRKNLHVIVWYSGYLDYSELANTSARTVKGKKFCKGDRTVQDFGQSNGEKSENLENHSCLNFQDLVVGEMWICSNYPFRHKTTLQCAECRANLFGNWILNHLKLLSLFCEIHCQYLPNYFLKIPSILFPIFNIEIFERAKWMTTQTNNYYLGKIVLGTAIKKKIMVLLGTNLFQTFIFVFVPIFGDFVEFFGSFSRIHLSKTCDESNV